MNVFCKSDEDHYIFLYKQVIDFTGMSYVEVKKLPCDEFMLLYKHSIIDKLSKSQEGIKKLNEAAAFENTEPDVDKLRKFFGKGV